MKVPEENSKYEFVGIKKAKHLSISSLGFLLLLTMNLTLVTVCPFIIRVDSFS